MPQAQSMQLPPRVPLLIEPENRYNSPNVDARLVNCYMETVGEGKYEVYKRPGLGNQQIVNNNAAGMGVYTWNNNVYSIFGGILYKNGAQVATGLDTSAGVYQFSSIMGSDPKLVMNNGAQGYAYDDTALLSANLFTTSGNIYPQFTVKGWAYLDGAQYVMQHFFGSAITPAVIWGSAINSVTGGTDWSALDFITAQIEPDAGVCMAKQLVYVVALCNWSTEFFFDAGNATGSPLQSIPGSKSSYGCASQDSVQNIEDVLFWLSTNRSASNQVVMCERLQPRVISTKAIDRLLNNIDTTAIYSWQIKINGHSFYVLTFVNANLTLAYDIKENMWSQWTDTNGNYLPICASAYTAGGNVVVQHATNGSLYYMDSTYLDDSGTVINADIYTPNFDGGTRRRKQMNFLEFVTDQVTGNYMTVQMSDDDYQTWTQPRRVDMSQQRAFLTNCGTFTRRAFHLHHAIAQPFRISAMETQFDIGTL
jgi:Phage stabilisation protein